MTKLVWDQVGSRVYETGVSNGVLYIPNSSGAYTNGYAWSGLTTITESPSGAESNPQYADNIKYINLISAETFGGTVEAFTYPDEFAQCDGTAVVNGVQIGQQTRRTFGLAYKTLMGNDLENTDYGYKIHLIYGATAAPSEKAHSTVNDSPEAITFSWDLSTTAVAVGTIDGVTYKPTSTLTIPSNKVSSSALSDLEDILFGTAGVDPRLPLPAEVLALFAGSVTQVTPTAPTYNSTTKVITIPSVTGVDYQINGSTVSGTVTITTDTVVTAVPESGYKFPAVTDDDWLFTY